MIRESTGRHQTKPGKGAKDMRKSIAVSAVLLFLLSLGVCVGPAFSADKEVEIKVGHVGAPVSPQQGAADIFLKLVEQKTKGTVKMKVYNSSQLGNEAELVEGLRMGTIDGGIISSGLFATSYNVCAAFEVPFLFKNSEHVLKIANGPVGDDLLKKLESKAGLKPIAIWDHGFRQLTNKVRPIKEPADMKGLKIRSPEVPVYSFALDALGAVPVPLAFTELYIALDSGVVDGQHNPLMHVKGQRFYEVQKYLSVMDFAYTPNIVAFSKKAWGKLSADQQKAVIEAAKETAPLWAAQSVKEEKAILEELKGKIQILTSDQTNREAFVKIVKEKAYPKYQDKFGPEFVDFLNKVLEAGK